jgi:hypothetical protein
MAGRYEGCAHILLIFSLRQPTEVLIARSGKQNGSPRAFRKVCSAGLSRDLF